jgi:hypothetical protein
MPEKKRERKAFLYRMRLDHHAALKAQMEEGRDTVRGQGVLPEGKREPYSMNDLLDEAVGSFLESKAHEKFHREQMRQWLMAPSKQGRLK